MRSSSGYALLLITAGLPITAHGAVDYQCMSDCSNRNYTYAYCRNVCSYSSPSQQLPPIVRIDPVGAMRRAEQDRLDRERQQQEIANIRAQRRLIEEQRRALELENQRQAATSQQTPAGPATAELPDHLKQFLVAVQPRRHLYPDFDQVVYATDVSISNDMVRLMSASPYAADIAYYLGTHKSEATAIFNMPLLDAGRAISDIEARVKVSAPIR